MYICHYKCVLNKHKIYRSDKIIITILDNIHRLLIIECRLVKPSWASLKVCGCIIFVSRARFCECVCNSNSCKLNDKRMKLVDRSRALSRCLFGHEIQQQSNLPRLSSWRNVHGGGGREMKDRDSIRNIILHRRHHYVTGYVLQTESSVFS